jgi:hypothetical protein
MIERRTLALVLALTLAPIGFAQSLILVSEGDCGEIVVHATRSSSFPHLGDTIAAEQVNHAYVVKERKRLEPKPVAASHSLDYTTNLDVEDRVVMAAVTLDPEERGNETRTESAKALLFCGGATPQSDWQRSSGLPFEIYPQGWNGPRPTLKAGDTMWFIAVDALGKSGIVRNLPMELYNAKGELVGAGTPTSAGGMAFAYPTPGRYMVKATWRRADPTRADHWLVDVSTLTFDVK